MNGTPRARVSFVCDRFAKLGFVDYSGGPEGGLQVHRFLLGGVLHGQLLEISSMRPGPRLANRSYFAVLGLLRYFNRAPRDLSRYGRARALVARTIREMQGDKLRLSIFTVSNLKFH